MLKKLRILLVLILGFGGNSFAISKTDYFTEINYLKNYISNPVKVGEGSFSFFFWDIYDAKLYADNGNFSQEKPFALKLRYQMSFKGEDIVKSTIDELKKHGVTDELLLSKWQKDLLKIFPDVNENQILTGVYTDKKTAVFLNNGKIIGEMKDEYFAKKFFEIWLSEKTTAPSLRKSLLARK
ncbi:MAG: chalcone isomerase family protein [Rickettsiales bacterium]|nr:chalcone isomerase family protein [Rickettsiales bacterium]